MITFALPACVVPNVCQKVSAIGTGIIDPAIGKIDVMIKVPVVDVGDTAQINTAVGVGDVVGIAAVVVAIEDLISVGAAAVIGRVIA